MEFRKGRDAVSFPGVKLDTIDDKEFVELLSEVDLLFITIYKMN